MRTTMWPKTHWTWLYVVTFILVAAISFRIGQQVEINEAINLPIDYN